MEVFLEPRPSWTPQLSDMLIYAQVMTNLNRIQVAQAIAGNGEVISKICVTKMKKL